MKVFIEAIGPSSAFAWSAAAIRKEVFENEWKRTLEPPMLQSRGQHLDLIARLESSGEPVAVLTVAETTGNAAMHKRFGLPFKANDRAARYTQLAVLKPYRGMDIPLQLILEAKRRFVKPGGFQYTWLLFDAERASNSSLCRRLNFHAGTGTYRSEYGRVRTLTRDEKRPEAYDADSAAMHYIAALKGFPNSEYQSTIPAGFAASNDSSNLHVATQLS